MSAATYTPQDKGKRKIIINNKKQLYKIGNKKKYYE
jgi:hypothetical protein